MAARRLGALAFVLLLVPAALRAQVAVGPGGASYEDQYGQPVAVRLEDLIQNPGQYYRRSVKTNGRLDFASNTSSGVGTSRYSLRDGYGNAVRLIPMPDVATAFEERGEDLARPGHRGHRRGRARSSCAPPPSMQGELILLSFWGFIGPEEEDKDIEKTAKGSTLEALVTKPGRQDGRTIRVVGKFRGRNLFGDLPLSSQRNTSEWVIKDDVFAVWISGKKPKGKGWELDPGLKRDTEKWIEVYGKPETKRGITYVRALRVNLTTAPSPLAQAKPPTPPPPRRSGRRWSSSRCRWTARPGCPRTRTSSCSSTRTWTSRRSRARCCSATRGPGSPATAPSTASA